MSKPRDPELIECDICGKDKPDVTNIPPSVLWVCDGCRKRREERLRARGSANE